MNKKTATLGKKDNNYSFFQVGDITIKFYTSPYLECYCRINKWKDTGYIEYVGKLSTTKEPVEDSIDLGFIAERLHLPKTVFKGIEEVKII
ncbi:MAG: hypothetical protein IKS87_06840 [Lachnospiraceae bacterium]|nr:hypothetical protein [Lachnospiraceae bacterium]